MRVDRNFKTGAVSLKPTSYELRCVQIALGVFKTVADNWPFQSYEAADDGAAFNAAAAHVASRAQELFDKPAASAVPATEEPAAVPESTPVKPKAKKPPRGQPLLYEVGERPEGAPF